ncbi:hypothetical protein [Sulfurimonas sp.]|uniref:hypothetical protein n=1 Tax=Sulfurimonas sp. TaxID=2022749 RepID=UPI0019FB3906|nr:hypothetical protein [Sulfurimonas sp.]MBE0515120.1 hypothetical protein [Sulfurimonas sp.]
MKKKKTQIKIDKSMFEFDLFWSIEDGSLIDIDTLINVYSQYSNTKNMKALVALFSKEKVLSVIESQDILSDEHKIAHKINIGIINGTTTENFTSENLAPFTV